MMKTKEIHIRDPFVLPVEAEKKYYLYGTTDLNCWGGRANGFDYYTSADLENWEGPFMAFRPEKDFWADRNFWAPEVHAYRSGYCMLASFKSENERRGTQVLFAQTPRGPFRPLTAEPVTPRDWECLDGTLYVEDGDPWIVFCHEWLQVNDGEIHAMRLTPDLKKAAAEPELLFHASESGWSKHFDGVPQGAGCVCYVTDGPFLYQTEGGPLYMLWSSFGAEGYAIGAEGYAIGAAKSEGGILGPWKHQAEPIFAKDGGHGMIFRTFDGRLLLSIHQPNKTPDERPAFFEIAEHGGALRLV